MWCNGNEISVKFLHVADHFLLVSLCQQFNVCFADNVAKVWCESH